MAIDIDQSFYNTGTASVENGGTIVTGQGTQWISSIRANDIFGTHKGDGVRILSVESNTSLTLAYPWTGETQATAPYEVQFTPYDTGYYPAVRQLLQTMSSGNVEAFASLTGAPNMVPIFTGPGAMELADPSTFGLQDPNGSLGKLAALTLAAQQILQTDAEGDLKQVALAANKALATDANGDVAPIDLGTLGRALLALASGTSAQYIRADGTLQTLDKSAVGLGNVNNTSDAAKPISTATQTALNAKLNLSGGTITGPVVTTSTLETRGTIPKIYMISPGSIHGYRMEANISDTVNGGWRIGAGYTGGALFQVLSNGDAVVAGALSAASKSFKTDHPLDPYNKDIVYASTESPSHGIEYWGSVRLVDGRAIVDVDGHYGMTSGTFHAMTKDTVLFFQNQDSGKAVYRRWLDDGTFEIICDDETCEDLIGWHVKGERKDAVVFTLPNTDSVTGRLIPEQEKPDYVEVENA